MPPERTPSPSPIDYRPAGWYPYRVKSGDDWKSIARRCHIPVQNLIAKNCGYSIEPVEVNWYLHWRIGCTKLTPDRRNYMFSNDAYPGIIWTPVALQKIEVVKDKRCRWVEKQSLAAALDAL